MAKGPEHVSNGMNRFLAEMFTHWKRIDAPAWNNQEIRSDIQRWFAEHPDLEKEFGFVNGEQNE